VYRSPSPTVAYPIYTKPYLPIFFRFNVPVDDERTPAFGSSVRLGAWVNHHRRYCAGGTLPPTTRST
jgi:hypothetical protein